MKKEMVVHMFATVQSLEKCVAQNRRMLAESNTQPGHARAAVEQQQRVLTQMRRVANRLQLLLVKKDWVEIVRLTSVFYGLNSLVRPEIMSMFSALANDEVYFQFAEARGQAH